MPLAETPGLTIYYEGYAMDKDRALILVNGLGSDHREWLYQVPFFKNHFNVITFDNRGSGISDTPQGPYTTGEMADDVKALMDYLSIERACVLGVSMGGLIVQEFAIRYPESLEKLILACTSPGGEQSLKPSEDAIGAFTSFDGKDPMASLKRMLPYLYSEKFLKSGHREIGRFLKYASEKKQNPEGYMSQLAALASHSSFDRLGEIEVPVLVITGDADRLIPWKNSEILTSAMRNARLEVIKGGPHRLFAENSDEFNRRVLEFLLE